MPLAQLDNLVRARQLKAEAVAQGEFDTLLRSGQARLKDARNAALSVDSRFDLAYNAAHALCLAALRWHGYRAENRYLVFQCLPHTLGLSADEWRALDDAHQQRNLAEYEARANVTEALVGATIRVAEEVERRVIALGPVSK
ncbi:MAG TPA: hypothetical protein VFY40_15380 [Blastocatellia bacterium]|nr:hypothetical protein [Blastocatellia bacterium]